MIGAIDARGIIDEVGVDTPAIQREHNARGLRHTQICSLADGLGPNVFGIDAQSVVGGIADLSVAFIRRFHIGPDTTKPDEVDRAFEDRRNQRRRFDLSLGHVERSACFLRQFDRLCRARENAAPF